MEEVAHQSGLSVEQIDHALAAGELAGPKPITDDKDRAAPSIPPPEQ